jgi:hypothetical protein
VHEPTLAGCALPLEYARPRATPAGRDWRWGVFLLALLPAAVSPFVKFAFYTSPLDTLFEYFATVRRGDWDEPNFFLLGAPFFTALPLWLWHARRFLWPAGSSVTVERVAAYTLAVLSLAVTTWVVVAVWWEGDTEGAVAYVAVAVMVSGMAACVRAWLKAGDRCAAPMIALMTAYASNGLMLLFAFSESDEVGYFLTIAAIVVMAVEAAWLLRGRAGSLIPD